MTPTHITESVRRWLEIREQCGLPLRDDPDGLLVDLEHSSLLRRLLLGQPPLDEAPPVRFSYPWYALIETSEGRPYEVWVPEPGLLGDEASIVIDQTRWRVVTTLGEQDWIAAYYTPDTKLIADLKASGQWEARLLKGGRPMRSSATRWRVHCEGKVDGRNQWLIERVSLG